MMQYQISLFLSLCICIAASTSAETNTAPPLTPLSLMLAWQPQAQFAGYYVAQSHGFYREAGIDVTLLSQGDVRSPLAALRDGEVDLAILWLPTAVKARAEGVPLVNIAQLLQHASVLLIARTHANIKHLSDLTNQRVGVWMGDPALPIEAVLRAHTLNVKRVPQSQTVNLFLRGGVEAMSGMLYNEYHLLLNAGLEPEELTVFRLSDYGIDCPEDGIYVLEQAHHHKSAAITAFVAATRRGWKQVAADPAGAVDLVLQYQRAARIPANRAHQRWMLEHILSVMEKTNWDWQLHRTDVERISAMLQRLKIIDAMPAELEKLGAK